MTEEKQDIVKQEELRPTVTTGLSPRGGLVPTDFDEIYRLARIFASSRMMPKGMESPAEVFVAIQAGAEIGLSPMQACQSMAVINGRPSLWGKAALGLVRASGLLEEFHEEELSDEKTGTFLGCRCTAKRKGDKKETVRTFTMADAKQANLSGKSGPWQQYPKRMCQMRARGFVLSDLFPDVLGGMFVAEESQDIPDKNFQHVERVDTSAIKERLEAAKKDVADEPDLTPPFGTEEPIHEPEIVDAVVVEEPPEDDEPQPQEDTVYITTFEVKPGRSGNFENTVTAMISKLDGGADELIESALCEFDETNINEVPPMKRQGFVDFLKDNVG